MLETERMILRRWREDDLPAFAEINADPEVMRYFEGTRSREESAASIKRFNAHLQDHGFGLFAAEAKADGRLLGLIGLHTVGSELSFGPTVEIGWRLRRDVWGKGLAPEGAIRCMKFAFSDLKLPEVVSFTAEINKPSQRVMEKIGMLRVQGGDFIHPHVTEGHRLAPHCLYRITKHEFSPS